MVVFRSRVLIVLLGAVTVAGCGGGASSPAPPANAGTVVVHVEFRSAPCSERTGRCSIEFPMGGVGVVLRDGNGARTVATTDKSGDAHFEIAPGRYRAALSAHVAETCDAGTVSAHTTARAHRLTRARVYCDAP